MNDPEIRKAFHRSILQKEHNQSNTLVVDELGLEHGKCRADIAVINGHLIGYEIKSDVDSLKRLDSQIISYNGIFDNLSLILTDRHRDEAIRILPIWWGVILAETNKHNGVSFEFLKSPRSNPKINNYAVAQLLWREEAQEILFSLGVRGARLREKRATLYKYLVEMLSPEELKHKVREYLKKRKDWRHPEQPFPSDG
jgi:hypothetical protein